MSEPVTAVVQKNLIRWQIQRASFELVSLSESQGHGPRSVCGWETQCDVFELI